ncbi:hypothetical protein VU03_01305, partial [Desulfobulbus sp. N3]|nr:hypothetical protein [Desulfobulbus sp. N3]
SGLYDMANYWIHRGFAGADLCVCPGWINRGGRIFGKRGLSPIPIKAAAVCGQLRAELEKKGQPLDLADLEIASIAMAGGFTLVTGNTRHFGRIEALRVENWLKG